MAFPECERQHHIFNRMRESELHPDLQGRESSRIEPGQVSMSHGSQAIASVSRQGRNRAGVCALHKHAVLVRVLRGTFQ